MVERTQTPQLPGHSSFVKPTIRVELVVKMPVIKIAIKIMTVVLTANTHPDQPEIAVAKSR